MKRNNLYDPRQLWLPLVVELFPKIQKIESAWERREDLLPEHWENEEIFRLHGYLLEESIRDLFCIKTGKSTKLEILEWVLSLVDQVPFSFSICCRLYGIDPDELRSKILGQLEKQANVTYH